VFLTINSCKILVEKPEEKKPLGRQRHVREENIKINFKQIVFKGVE
jgi:hypothetical protein